MFTDIYALDVSQVNRYTGYKIHITHHSYLVEHGGYKTQRRYELNQHNFFEKTSQFVRKSVQSS